MLQPLGLVATAPELAAHRHVSIGAQIQANRHTTTTTTSSATTHIKAPRMGSLPPPRLAGYGGCAWPAVYQHVGLSALCTCLLPRPVSHLHSPTGTHAHTHDACMRRMHVRNAEELACMADTPTCQVIPSFFFFFASCRWSRPPACGRESPLRSPPLPTPLLASRIPPSSSQTNAC